MLGTVVIVGLWSVVVTIVSYIAIISMANDLSVFFIGDH